MATGQAALGASIPAHTPHAISVSLPKWQDNVGYEEGEKRVVDAMVTGYPRFFIHLSIQKLARIFEQKLGLPGERCLIFPSKKVAASCRAFILDQSTTSGLESPHVRLAEFLLYRDGKSTTIVPSQCGCHTTHTHTCAELHIVLFPDNYFRLAKQFWQHVGTGISSRLAQQCLSFLSPDAASPPSSPTISSPKFTPKNKHYMVSPRSSQTYSRESPEAALGKDEELYMEERYGRNLCLSSAASAKRALRRRIAGALDCHSQSVCPGVEDFNAEITLNSNRVTNVTEDDVYLFPTGMAAIWNTHQLLLAARPPNRSVCFGFPYIDTLKILEKWGPGCHFLGQGLDSSIDELEILLETKHSADPTVPPILALFTEIPSNPLLRCADLPRLRRLADKYDFLMVVDETIGNFVNVEVLPYCDIVVSSLTKVFSGDSNVMGGSLILNRKGRHYDALKVHIASLYEDIYFDEDAIYMERNSRTFEQRIKIIDSNAETISDFLWSQSLAGGLTSAVIKDVFYPKYHTREHYDRCRGKDSDGKPRGGFGGLLSLTFTSDNASKAFFDALPSYKGPSLGTSFTLACPYTILAHYWELEWAAKYGIEETLIRVSVGIENKEELLKAFQVALNAAHSATTSGVAPE